MNWDHFIYGALAVGLVWLVLAVAGVVVVRYWAQESDEERWVRIIKGEEAR
jgi:hypothetical protein